MHTTKSLQVFNSRQLLRFIPQVLTLLFLLNISACACKQSARPGAASTSINMTIAKTLLVADENNIEVNFEMGDAEKPVVLSNFKLKISILEQRTVAGTTTGSQIRYKDAAGVQQTFSDTFEKQLTEFTSFSELNAQNQITKFKVDFAVLPASMETVQIKLNVELIAAEGKSIQNIPVEWIKSKMIITPPTKFKDKESSFTLINLAEDIKDLNKITLIIHGIPQEASFSFVETSQSQATLAALLPGTTELARGEETKPIKIINDFEDEALFSILVAETDALADNFSLAQEKMEQPQVANDSKLENDLKELEQAQEEEQVKEKELKQLEEEKKILNDEIKHVSKEVKKDEKIVRYKLRQELKELKQKRNEDLKDKNEVEKRIIKKKYRKTKRKILAAAGSKALKGRLHYGFGFGNALVHNMFAIPLKDPRTPIHAKAHQHGHRASLIFGRVETALGPILIAIGIGAMIAGTGPTLGGISVAAIPMIGVGTGILAHGVFTAERAQSRIEDEKDKKHKKKKRRKRKKHSAHEEPQHVHHQME